MWNYGTYNWLKSQLKKWNKQSTLVDDLYHCRRYVEIQNVSMTDLMKIVARIKRISKWKEKVIVSKF